MEQHDKTTPTAALIDAYRRQLMEMYRQQTPAVSPTPAPPSEDTRAASAPQEDTATAARDEEENWLDSRFPLPDPERDRAALMAAAPPAETPVGAEETPPAEQAEEPTDQIPTFPYTDADLNGQPPFPQEPLDPPAITESPFVGYLRVFVFTGGGAEPLEGARVVVSRQEGDTEVIYANAETDRDGFTPVIPLPSVNPELTLRPDIANPFVAYDIQVNADGFGVVRHENVPVYGNNYVTQPVALVPLLPGEDVDSTRRFYSNGPADL